MVVDALGVAVERFGPFLIPVVLFLIGVSFYALWVLVLRFRDGENYRAE